MLDYVVLIRVFGGEEGVDSGGTEGWRKRGVGTGVMLCCLI